DRPNSSPIFLLKRILDFTPVSNRKFNSGPPLMDTGMMTKWFTCVKGMTTRRAFSFIKNPGTCAWVEVMPQKRTNHKRRGSRRIMGVVVQGIFYDNLMFFFKQYLLRRLFWDK